MLVLDRQYHNLQQLLNPSWLPDVGLWPNSFSWEAISHKPREVCRPSTQMQTQSQGSQCQHRCLLARGPRGLVLETQEHNVLLPMCYNLQQKMLLSRTQLSDHLQLQFKNRHGKRGITAVARRSAEDGNPLRYPRKTVLICLVLHIPIDRGLLKVLPGRVSIDCKRRTWVALA